MKKSEFVKELAVATNIKQKDVKKLVNVMGELIVAHMQDDEGITPFNGIKFYTTYRDRRIVRNPQNGEPITIEPMYTPRVKFGRHVKKAIN